MPTEEWDIIHKKYQCKNKIEAKAVAKLNVSHMKTRSKVTPKFEASETFLETSKYVSGT